jgi:hypothetical protein
VAFASVFVRFFNSCVLSCFRSRKNWPSQDADEMVLIDPS